MPRLCLAVTASFAQAMLRKSEWAVLVRTLRHANNGSIVIKYGVPEDTWWSTNPEMCTTTQSIPLLLATQTRLTRDTINALAPVEAR